MMRQLGKLRISKFLIDAYDPSVLESFQLIGFLPIDVDYYTSYDEIIYTGILSRF